MRDWVISNIFRLETRSASEPPQKENGRSGMTVIKLTIPNEIAEPVRR